MNTITIPMNILASAVNFAGVKDIRPALNGVHIEVKYQCIQVTATDGHILGTYKWECETPADLQGKNFTIHVDDLKPHLRGEHLTIAVTEEQGGTVKLRMGSGKIVTETSAIDSPFLDFRGSIPDQIVDSAEHAWIDPVLLARADKAGRILKRSKKSEATPLRILHNGAENAQPFVYEDCDDFYGVVAPMRPSAKGNFMTQMPDWVKGN